MNRTGALVKYQKPAFGHKTEYVARHASIPHAANTLRLQKIRHNLRLFNDPTFSASRAAELIHSFKNDYHGFSMVDYLHHVRYEVLESFWQQYSSEIKQQLKSTDPTDKAKAIMVLDELGYYLKPRSGDEVLPLLKKVPDSVQIYGQLSVDTIGYVKSLRLKIKTVQALALLDNIFSKLSKDSYVADIIGMFLRDNLEYFPIELEEMIALGTTDEITQELRVPRDRQREGTAVETMRKLLLSKEITEDLIKRLQGTKYCRQPYGQAEKYRDHRVWRDNGRDTREMLSPTKIRKKMKELVNWVNAGRGQELHPFIRAIIFYARYDEIHPFPARTKHVGRFIMSKIMLEAKLPPMIEDQDLHLPLLIKDPGIDRSGRWVGPINSYSLLIEGKHEELVFHLLALYIQKLGVYLGQYFNTRTSGNMQEIENIMGTETNPLWRSGIIR